MTFAPLEVQKELYLLLAQDDGIIDLLGEDSGTDDTSSKVFDFVPDNTEYPYITLQILPWLQRDNYTLDGMECDCQINVFYRPGTSGNTGRGNKQIYLIQQRIDEILHNQKDNLCVDGWNILQLRRTFLDIVTEDDNITKQGIQRFLIYIGEK